MEDIEDVSLQSTEKSINGKKSLKHKIRELENVVETKLTKLKEELLELKKKETIHKYNFSDLLEEFKNDVKKKIEETNEMFTKHIEQQNKKHVKLLNMLISLKMDYVSLSKTVSLLEERVRILEEDVGE